MSEKIVFFGNEKLATGLDGVKPLIRDAAVKAGFEIEQHVTGKLSELRTHESKLAVLAAYGRIIPQNVLDEFPLGIINVHPSLLPLYRGPTPIEQAILDGVSKTGVSIMRLTAGMDEGPIYKQKTLHLRGDESKTELMNNLQLVGSKLILELLPNIVEGKIKPRSQPHPNRASYTKLLTKNDGKIDWLKPAEEIERQIRAFVGWPQSYTKIGNLDLIITKASVIDKDGPAGKLEIEDNNLLIYCGKKALRTENLKPAGKKEMSASAFLAGYRSKFIKN